MQCHNVVFCIQSTGVRELRIPVRFVSILVCILLYAMRVMLCAVRDRKGVRTVKSKPVVCCVTEEFRRLTNAMGDTKTENVFRKFKKN